MKREREKEVCVVCVCVCVCVCVRMKSFSIYRVPAVAGSTVIERERCSSLHSSSLLLFSTFLRSSHSLFLCLLSLIVDSSLSYYVYLFDQTRSKNPPWVATSSVPFRISISFPSPPLSPEAYYSLVFCFQMYYFYIIFKLNFQYNFRSL